MLMHEKIKAMAANICKVEFHQRPTHSAFPSDAGAVSLYTEGAVLFFMDNIADYDKLLRVARHEIIGHMAPRKAMGKQYHDQWCLDVERKFRDSALHVETQYFYGRNPRVVGDEIIARIAEKPVTILDNLRMREAARIKLKLYELQNIARLVSWSADFTASEGFTRLMRK